MRAAGVVGWRVVRARLAAAPHPAVPPGTKPCQRIKQIRATNSYRSRRVHAATISQNGEKQRRKCISDPEEG